MRQHCSVLRIRLVVGIMALVLGVLLAACGGGSGNAPAEGESASESAESESADDADAGGGVPTMPAANFAQPTTQIGGSASASEPVTGTEMLTETENLTDTEPVTDAASGEETSSETPEPANAAADAAESDEQLARGESAYTRRCAECHGDDATGVEGSGSALVGLSLSESEFTSLLRTGGGLGAEHLFGPQKISPGSLDALYLYLQSLPTE